MSPHVTEGTSNWSDATPPGATPPEGRRGTIDQAEEQRPLGARAMTAHHNPTRLRLNSLGPYSRLLLGYQRRGGKRRDAIFIKRRTGQHG